MKRLPSFARESFKRLLEMILYGRSEYGEFISSSILALWGALLILPGLPDILVVNPSYKFLLTFAPEPVWGGWFLFFGCLGLGALWRGSFNSKGSFRTRKFVILMNVATWATVSTLMFVTEWHGALLGLATYSVLTWVSVVNYFRIVFEEKGLSGKGEIVA